MFFKVPSTGSVFSWCPVWLYSVGDLMLCATMGQGYIAVNKKWTITWNVCGGRRKHWKPLGWGVFCTDFWYWLSCLILLSSFFFFFHHLFTTNVEWPMKSGQNLLLNQDCENALDICRSFHLYIANGISHGFHNGSLQRQNTWRFHQQQLKSYYFAIKSRLI